METIRILLYTDSANISENKHLWGLTSLQQFVKLKISGLAYVRFTLLNRHFDYKSNQPRNGATPLTAELLKNYDELWVFGVRQQNSTKEPNNELDKCEVAALRCWMDIGGVLITGDHSDTVGNLTCESDHLAFVNLGAALGRSIPRAGQLRVWDGPPTGCYDGVLELRDNHNTQEGIDPLKLDDMTLQTDSLPQTLRLTPSDPPHRLFWWHFDPSSQGVVPIDKFPDHLHEGDLAIPATMEGDWPPQSHPPSVVAFGRDKRFPKEQRFYRLVMAYDGDSVGVGRIVADSSFHHYIDRNLLDIPTKEANGDPKPTTDLDQIAQYYCNLALWLAPQKTRARIGWGLFFWTASHPEVMEDRANGPQTLGKTAMKVLMSEIGASNLYRLLAPSKYEQDAALINVVLAFVFLGLESSNKISIQPHLALGYIVKEYHRLFAEIGLSDPGWVEEDPATPEVALKGLQKAMEREWGAADAELLDLFRKSTETLTQ
jgi:hypothetical protein